MARDCRCQLGTQPLLSQLPSSVCLAETRFSPEAAAAQRSARSAQRTQRFQLNDKRLTEAFYRYSFGQVIDCIRWLH